MSGARFLGLTLVGMVALCILLVIAGLACNGDRLVIP
jgi:hypothetical protein